MRFVRTVAAVYDRRRSRILNTVGGHRPPLQCVVLLLAAAMSLSAQQAATIRALSEPWPEIVKVDGIEILHVQKNIYMLAGAGANVTVQIGDEGVLLVDAGSSDHAEGVVAAIRH